MSNRGIDDYVERTGSSSRRDDHSVRSESSSVSFSSTKLGQMLAEQGFESTSGDFTVPQRSYMGNQDGGSARRSSSRPSDDRSVHSTDSSTSFSETALGQLLASQGMKASRDFEVPQVAPAPVKKNLVQKVLKSTTSRGQRHSHSTKSSRRRRHSKPRSSRVEEDLILFEDTAQPFPVYPTTMDLNENLEIDFGDLAVSNHHDPGIVLIDDSAPDTFYDEEGNVDVETFQDEVQFSGDDLYLTEFGARRGGYHDDPSSHCSSRHYSDNVTSPSAQGARAAPYHDNSSTRSTRTVHWPYEASQDPYRDNLQPCEISELSMPKAPPTTNRRRLWLWCSIFLISVVAVGGVLLTRKHGEDSHEESHEASKHAESKRDEVYDASAGAVANAHDRPHDQPLAGDPNREHHHGHNTTGMSTGTEATSATVQPDIHYENDPRFFHDWTGASLSSPIVDYALHPVQRHTKLLIKIAAPSDAGEPVRLHVYYRVDADMHPGDVGCGDHAVQTMAAGTRTTIRIDAFHTAQIVACVENTVVAATTHVFVVDWDGEEKVKKTKREPQYYVYLCLT